ncbi:MAG: DUF4331 family protein [Gemmatimonadales bacterium]|nr:DUF4331 family protein [Gemmatimonadales bacterium]
MRLVPFAAAALLALGATACNDSVVAVTPERQYNQIQRLGNPLVSEVLLAKRSHPVHGNIGPEQDVALLGAEIKEFVRTVGGRSAGYADALGGVLLPDMLIVQTDKPPATAGWLNWVGLAPFQNGYGGRRLADDVTDLALLAVFGDPLGLDPAGAVGKAALTTDNVAFTSAVTTTFPYLAPPTN